ncbi:hypothetical protein GGX14DRAFT_569059 [Mycena pura]|uniref:Uncharacterized protein n=1 Tax=Mycena pura TaxID=153505 RepID=A0AAD6Y8H3_9AGAR|nr:hypothetical protein GGX14DRAFT_569059 [Mycena pura]
MTRQTALCFLPITVHYCAFSSTYSPNTPSMQASSASVLSDAVRSSCNLESSNSPPSASGYQHPHPNSDAREMKLSFRSDVTFPSNAAEAQQLLHVLYARSETRRLEKRAASRRIHEQLVYLSFLQHELNRAAERAQEADKDLGLARATIRAAGLPVPFGVEDCAFCSELYYATY